MPPRARLFRLFGLAALGLGLAVAAAGVAAYPYPLTAYLSRKGFGSPSGANLYYALINAPATFAGWQAAYYPNTTGAVSAVYYNAADLGFGREMHCRESAAFTACYVVNHGLGPAAPSAQALQDAVHGQRVLPTVAMVYDRAQDGQPNDVRFYIYDVDGDLIPSVSLDSEGDKSAPHLCLACHGGDYDNFTHSISGANFLPFDAASFLYSAETGYTRAAQEDALRRLNALVHNTSPDPKIKTLIEGWYGGAAGVTTPGTALDGDYLPPAYDGSTADRALYDEVVKPFCRGCHVALATALDIPAQVDAAFSTIYTTNEMPHAEVTAHNFWSSPAPAVLARSRGWAYRVNTLADPVPDGCDSASCSLREAILAANADPDMSIIVFDVDGVFRLERAGADDAGSVGDLDITTSLVLLGNGPARTILDGAGLDRVLHVQVGTHVVVQGVTIRNGQTSADGGGLLNDGGLLFLHYSVLRDNGATAESGAGGGLAAVGSGITRIDQSTIGPGNISATRGGGLYVTNSSLLYLRDSTLSGNTSSTGGGLYVVTSSTAELDHTTVVLNTAGVNGGGLAVVGSSQLSLGRSLVSGNTSPGQANCLASVATLTSLGYNLLGPNGAAGGCPTVAADQLHAGSLSAVIDLQLRPDPARGVLVHMPLPNSPALDAIPLGQACATASYDARNVARPLDAGDNGSLGCDIGAVEGLVWLLALPLLVR